MNSLKSSRPAPRRASTFSLFAHYWLPPILWMGFIFWMSTGTFSSEHTSPMVGKILSFLVPGISSEAAELIHLIIRKAAHVTEYFILGLLIFRAFRGSSTSSWSCRWPFFAIIVVVLCALSDEFHQFFVPVREASVLDVGMDTAGGILAQLVSVWRHCYWKK